jgi:hypothetical protein
MHGETIKILKNSYWLQIKTAYSQILLPGPHSNKTVNNRLQKTKTLHRLKNRVW